MAVIIPWVGGCDEKAVGGRWCWFKRKQAPVQEPVGALLTQKSVDQSALKP